MSISTISGREPTLEETKLLDFFDELTKGSITSLDESAKQLVGWITAMYGLFFAAFSFSQTPHLIAGNLVLKIFGAITLSLYFVSMLLSIRAFIPRTYTAHEHSLTEKRQSIEKILGFKRKLVTWAYVLFSIATFSLGAVLTGIVLTL
jgi:hypothetical protein